MEILTNEDAKIRVDQTFVETFKRYPALKEYDEVLRFAFTAFYKQGGHVRFDPDRTGSIFEPFPLLGGRSANLVIGVKDRIDPMGVIWVSFHEWGHLSQPILTDDIRLNPTLTHQRESEAWDLAEVKLKDYAILQPHFDQFYLYRNDCLKSYQKKISNNPIT
ncbi:hypothetical protein ABIC74_000820 [Mucilaginibacter rubeus]|uniref:hypothetical protein n=1 Tax=Mucilaginibacter rubeus TaxID=2027860 RepID=UPI0033969D8F